MRKYIALAAVALAALFTASSAHSQVILAGWYSFPGNLGSFETTGKTPDVFQAGVTGSLFGGDGSRPTESSTDGFFGNSSFATGVGDTASAGTPVANGAMTLRDFGTFTGNPTASDHILSITITNGGVNDITLSSFLYDVSVFNTDNQPLTFRYASGDLDDADDTLIGTSPSFTAISVTLGNYTDASFDIAAVLTDTTLSNGQSATFFLINPDPAGQASQASRLDNLAFSGTVVPEPSSALLITLGLAGLVLRRRR